MKRMYSNLALAGGLLAAGTVPLSVQAVGTLVLTPLGFTNGQFKLQAVGDYATAMQWQVSSNLVNWDNLAAVTPFEGSSSLVDSNSPGHSSRFYRAVLMSPNVIESLYAAPQYTSAIGNPISSCGCSSPENPNSSAAPGNAQDNAMGSVYLQTGELTQGAVDLSIPGVGFDWRFERHYRSGMAYNGPLGQGWDFSQNRRLVVQPNGNVKRVDGAGRTDLYILLSSNNWQAPSGFYTRLTRNPDRSFVEQDRHGMRSFFSAPDSFGVARLAQLVDRNSNSMSFSYNASGQLTNVIDTLGRAISYQYHTNGELAQIVDFIGRTVTFGYDPGGDLTSVTGPAVTGTPNGNDFPNGKTTLYTYDANHHLLTVTAPNEAATGGPSRLQAWYDPVSSRLTQLRSGGTNTTGVAAGGTLTYSYSNLALAGPGDVATAVLQTTVTNRNGNVTQYQFNQLGNVLSLIQFTRGIRASDPAAFTNTFTFNADGETLTHTFPASNSVQFTYSTNSDRFQQGNLLQTVRLPGPRGGDQSSITTSMTYETNFNFVATSTDARGYITAYTYDANGNCTHITHRIQSIVEDFTYNAQGQVTSHLLPDNGSGSRRLDTNIYYTTAPELGYLQDRIVDFGTTNFNIDNHFDYDAVGNVTNATDGFGNNTIYIVNSLNQVVRMLSRIVATASGQVRYQTDTFYDANDNATKVAEQNIDDSGAVVASLPTINTGSVYDILDNRVRRSWTRDATHTIVATNSYDADQNPAVAASGEAVNGHQPNNVIRTLYDERDLVYQRVRAPNDPGHSTTQYNYDGNGNPISTLEGVEDTLFPRTTTWSYDGFDRQISMLDAMGNITAAHYDANGNITNRTVLGELVDVPGSAGNTNLASTTWTYDAMDRRVISDAALFNTVTHTNIGGGHSITHTFYSDNSQVVTNLDANGNATSTTYDSANRLYIVTDAEGNTTTYMYDANNNITSTSEVDQSDSGQPAQYFSTSYSYDGLDRLSEIINSIGGLEADTYDSRNNRLSHLNENGNFEQFQYDGLNRRVLTSLYLVGTNGVTLPQTWDDSSRLTSQTDGNANVTTYVYDSLNRLTATVFADGTSSTDTYDVHDNRVSFTDQNGTITLSAYDLLNRLTTNNVTPAPGVMGPLFESFKYDGLSRVVQATNANSLVTRQYDSLSRLTLETQQTLPAGVIGTNIWTYDPVGNQLQCVYPGGLDITKSYDGLNRVRTVANGGLVLASNLYIGQTRLEGRLLGNGMVLGLYYDGIRRISEMQYSNTITGHAVDDLTFSYDANGNKLSASSINQTYTYMFDALDRLTNAFNLNTSQSTGYALDGANNRTSVTGAGGGIYTRNSGSDLAMNQYSVTPFGTSRYDHDGNLTNSSGRQMSYDYRNQLVFFSFSTSGPSVAIKYDALGRRVLESSTNKTVTFYYNGSDVIQENVAGGVTNTYVYGNTGCGVSAAAGRIICMILGSGLYFPLCDDVGTCLEVAGNATAGIVEEYTYSPGGQPSFFNGSGQPLSASLIGNPYLFSTERYDFATPFGYRDGRYVDYNVGEFITRAPSLDFGDDLGNSRAYDDDNPVGPVPLTNRPPVLVEPSDTNGPPVQPPPPGQIAPPEPPLVAPPAMVVMGTCKFKNLRVDEFDQPARMVKIPVAGPGFNCRGIADDDVIAAAGGLQCHTKTPCGGPCTGGEGTCRVVPKKKDVTPELSLLRRGGAFPTKPAEHNIFEREPAGSGWYCQFWIHYSCKCACGR